MQPRLRKQNKVANAGRYRIKEFSALLPEVQTRNFNQCKIAKHYSYQRARRRTDNTQEIFVVIDSFLFFSKLIMTCPDQLEKNVAGQVDFVRSIYLSQRRFCEIKVAVFFWKNENPGDVKVALF